MNRYNLFFTLLLAVSAVLFTLGVVKKLRSPRAVENAGARRKAVIAVIPKGTINMWWDVVRQGAVQAGEEYGVEIRWNGPEVETDREKQIQAVRDALVQKVDAVVLGPNDFKALVRPIEEVHEQGIPCVIIDSAADTDIYDAFAATDNLAGGADAARLLGKALGCSSTSRTRPPRTTVRAVSARRSRPSSQTSNCLPRTTRTARSRARARRPATCSRASRRPRASSR